MRDGRFECVRRPVIVLFRFPVKQNYCHDFQFLLSDLASGRQIYEYLSDHNSNSFLFAAIPIKNNRIRFCRENHLNLKKKKKKDSGHAQSEEEANTCPTQLFPRSLKRVSSASLSPPPPPPQAVYRERPFMCDPTHLTTLSVYSVPVLSVPTRS